MDECETFLSASLFDLVTGVLECKTNTRKV